MSDLDDEELKATQSLYQGDIDNKLFKLGFVKKYENKTTEIFKKGLFFKSIVKINYKHSYLYLKGKFTSDELELILKKLQEFRCVK
jgi:hypothetical protein